MVKSVNDEIMQENYKQIKSDIFELLKSELAKMQVTCKERTC